MKPEQDSFLKQLTTVQTSGNFWKRKLKGQLFPIFNISTWSQIRSVVTEIQ